MTTDESGFADMAAHAEGRDPRDEIRRLARARRAESTPPLSYEEIARRAGINRDTVSDFFKGNTWPQPSRLDAIELALGLPSGTFDGLLRGEPAQDITGQTDESPDDDSRMSDLIVRFHEDALGDLSPTEREEVEAAAKAAALQRIREIRGQ